MNMVDFTNNLLAQQAKVTKTVLTAGDIEYNDIETSTIDRAKELKKYTKRMHLQAHIQTMLYKHPHLLFKLNGCLIEEVWATVRHVDDELRDPIFDNDMEVVCLWKK